ncbi:MAG: lipid kinase YegS [Pirellulaceae bacterium]
MRSLRLILNGKSAGDPAVRAAVEQLRAEGYSIDVRVTWEAGQGVRFAEEAAAQGIDVVVAGGGDGTINEIVHGLMASESASRPALALLPLGTANDFARSWNVPLGDVAAALATAAQSPLDEIDVGLVNDCPFVNVASGGFGAEVTARTSPEMKNLLGGAAYSITGLLTAAQLTPYPCRLVAEGQTFDLSLAMLAIGNGRMAGGGYEVAPQARFDDGLLDLVLVPAVPLADLPTLVGELFNVSGEANQHVLYRQLAEFEIHFESEFQLNLDGEPLHGRDFHVSIMPRRLSIVRPA